MNSAAKNWPKPGAEKRERVTDMIIKNILFCVSFLVFPFAVANEVFTFTVKTDSHLNRELEFAARIPEGYSKADAGEYRIMVLFGGRNWDAEKTIRTYKFNKLADSYKLFLLSPSFKDDEYWEPEKWSGKALFQAVSELEKRYGLKPSKLFYYGYSAGGQCVALFYNYSPEKVQAWALHASGIYFDARNWKKAFAPGLITCGIDDYERYRISRNFIFHFRESGGRVIWIPYRNEDHCLTQNALDAAKYFFGDQLTQKEIFCIGEDDTCQTFPADKKSVENVLEEYRNYLTSERLMELWRNRQ